MPAHKYTPEKYLSLFWNKVNKNGSIQPHCPELGQCWEWTAGCFTNKYGIKKWHGKKETAHRVSWIINYGEIPNGLWVLHKCDNRKCVRPDHLFLGTVQDNADDRERKHRGNHLK